MNLQELIEELVDISNEQGNGLEVEIADIPGRSHRLSHVEINHDDSLPVVILVGE